MTNNYTVNEEIHTVSHGYSRCKLDKQELRCIILYSEAEERSNTLFSPHLEWLKMNPGLTANLP